MRINPKIRMATWLWAALFLALLGGCAVAPPIQEMSDARQAIEAAREANAEQKAPQSLHDAEAHMRRATQELEQGHYGLARDLAIAAKEQAIQARDNAVHAGKGAQR